LAKMPKLLLLDEPLAALDRKLRDETRRELIGIQERVGITFLVVTHDQEEALGMATHIAVMNEARIVQSGTPAEVYERPNSRFVASFVGEVNLFEGVLVDGPGCLSLAVAGFGQPIPLPAGIEAAAGAALALALRPEKLVLSHTRPAGFAVSATVSSVDYQGPVSIIHLAAEPDRLLKAHLASSAAGGFDRSGLLWASWSPEDAVVITR
jgi:putrescine transport system ATP-binding protein